jgi:cation/acetate symporter
MVYPFSRVAVVWFLLAVGALLGASLAGRRRADNRPLPWLAHGLAFAGDYLANAAWLGICGLIAFDGYDGFLLAIGLFTGWLFALLVIAEPLKRLGRWDLADVLAGRFAAPGLQRVAAASTLIAALLLLIPQVVGGAAILRPLLGLRDYHLDALPLPAFSLGAVITGAIVILLTLVGRGCGGWGQCLKGTLLVLLCAGLTAALLNRGLDAKPAGQFPRTLDAETFRRQIAPTDTLLPQEGDWIGKPFVRIRHATGAITTWTFTGMVRYQRDWPAATFTECQVLTAATAHHPALVDGLPQTPGNNLCPAGFVATLPFDPDHPDTPIAHSGPLGPMHFLAAIQNSTLALPGNPQVFRDSAGLNTVYAAALTPGQDVLTPGLHPALFGGLKLRHAADGLNLLSLMLALFCGAAAFPHFFARYGAGRAPASTRKSTLVAAIAIGLFTLLALFLGLGAAAGGALDPTDSNLALPLLARTFGELPFALLSAIAFTAIVGGAAALTRAAARAFTGPLAPGDSADERGQSAAHRRGKIAAACIAALAILLGMVLRKMNVALLVAWAFNVAASAHLPALALPLFWKRATRRGLLASIVVGLVSSLAWLLLSADAFTNLYGLPAGRSPLPFSQPALITLPLAGLTLIAVSLLTSEPGTRPRNP